MERSVLILDVDGVVIRGRPNDGRPWYATLQEDLGIDRDMLTERFFSAGFRTALRGQADILELLEPLFAEQEIETSVEQFVDYWFRNDARLNDELIEYVQSLRTRVDVHCFLATNQERRRTKYIRETLGLDAHFDAVVSSSDVGACKPEPEFFRAAHARLGLEPEDRVLFTDDREPFVEAAVRHGWQARLFQGNADLKTYVERWLRAAKTN